MFRNDIDAAMERARIAEDQLRRLEAKDEKSQAELDELRAALEAQRAEVARLRKLAPAPKPPAAAPSGRRFALVIVAAIALAAAGVFFLALRGSPSPQSAPPAVAVEPSRVVLAPRVQPAVEPAAPAPLGEELGEAAMTALLTANRWRGDMLTGELRFAKVAGKLEGRLATAGGAEQSLAVELGRLATLTLRLTLKADGMTERLTFHGALGADRRTIRGTVDRVLSEGDSAHAEQGVFTLTAVR